MEATVWLHLFYTLPTHALRLHLFFILPMHGLRVIQAPTTPGIHLPHKAFGSSALHLLSALPTHARQHLFFVLPTHGLEVTSYT